MSKARKAVGWEHARLLSEITQRITGHACRIESFGNGLYLVYRILDASNERECLV